jgi:uncharacterized metal-binding protein
MPRKGKSGRTKGAVSFLAINLRELNRVLKEDAIVVVSRRYAEQLQLDGKPMSASTKNIESYGKQIDVKIGVPDEDEGVANVKISDLSNEW